MIGAGVLKLLREPLLHFLVIGALLFGVFSWVSADDEAAPGEIVVSAGQIANLEAIFSRTWQRPPSAQELDGLVADYVRDEILYREAVAMGLDRDDAVIRRRLRQKMEFVADVMAEVEPTDAELKAYVSGARRAVSDGAAILLQPRLLQVGERASGRRLSWRACFSPSMRGRRRQRTQAMPSCRDSSSTIFPSSGVAQIFGEDFASLDGASGSGAWEGPVTSAYGTAPGPRQRACRSARTSFRGSPRGGAAGMASRTQGRRQRRALRKTSIALCRQSRELCRSRAAHKSLPRQRP